MLPVEILGVNEIGGGTNALMFAGKPLSWVRDTPELGIKDAWGATYRDVVILLPQNEPLEDSRDPEVLVFNLTLYDLRIEANKTALKNMLITAATPVDTDNDKLPDYWERMNYGDLSHNRASIHAGNITTLMHYAHCGPVPGRARPEGLPRIVGFPDGSVSVYYTRRRGTAFGLTCLPEFSATLGSWSASAAGWEEWSVRTLYDGSAGEVVEWKILQPGEARFVRVRSALP